MRMESDTFLSNAFDICTMRRHIVKVCICLLILPLFLPSLACAIDSSEIDEALDDGNVTILFFRDESSVCGIIMSMLSDISSSYDDVDLIEIFISDNADLADRFEVGEPPEVLVFDGFGSLHERITGARSRTFYEESVQGALAALENMNASADKFYQNATIFFDSGKYTNALQNFTMAEELYVELDNVERTLLCRMYIQKCNNYITAHDHLSQADELFEDGEYEDAALEYDIASTYFDKVNDEELIAYCSQQIGRCELIPSAEDDFSRVQVLMDSGRYGTARPLLVSLKDTYAAIGDAEKEETVSQLLTTCDLYLEADAYVTSGSSAMSEGNYDIAVEEYTAARDIYTDLGDSDKASMCTQNITLAQQYSNSQTPAPPEKDEEVLALDYRYIAIGATALLVILLSIVLYRRSSKASRDSGSAMARLSAGLSSTELEQVTEQEPEPVEENMEQAHDTFLLHRDSIFETKNTLLFQFSQWVDELLNEMEGAQPHQYFFFRGRFESLQAFFTRSFSSDEEYIDQRLLSDVRDRLHECQSRLNDLMDLV